MGSMTSDEQRCFSHFQYRVLPALGDFFDSVLWRKLVLQMGSKERAVFHAAVALSAIYQDIEVSGAPLPGQDLCNDWHYFAMDQAGRSLANLNSRSVSHDPHRQEVVLVCCLLFLLMELLRGRYDEAFQHLHAGLQILNELKAHKANCYLASPRDPYRRLSGRGLCATRYPVRLLWGWGPGPPH